MADSKLWLAAYESHQRQKKYWSSDSKIKTAKAKKAKRVKKYLCRPEDEFVVEQRGKLKELDKRIRELRHEQAVIKERIKVRKYGDNPWILYALKLENGFWYVGITHNVEKRFKKHLSGVGANWTALHKPIEIVETRKTVCLMEADASKLEDDMTLEYALKYGSGFVRGGGYCQRKPRWPAVIIQNEKPL